jgi:hypothetical protein
MSLTARSSGLSVGVLVAACAASGCAQDTVMLPTTRPADAGPRDAGEVDAGAPCPTRLEVVARRRFPDDMRFGTHTVPAGGGQVASLEAQDPRGKLARVDLVTGAEAALGEGFERLLEADEAGVLAVRGADEVYLRGGDTYPVAPALLVVDVPAAPSRRLDRTLIWGCPEPLSVVALAGDPPAPTVTLNPRRCPTFSAARDDAAVFVQVDPANGARSAALWRSESRTVRPLGSAGDRSAAAPYQRGAVWTSAGVGQVLLWTPEQPDGLILDEGPCVWLDARGDTIVMGCDPRPDATGIGFVDRLQLIGPQGARALRGGGGAILSPRLGDGFVTWLEYDDPQSVCPGAGAAGRLWVAPLDGGEPFALGPIDAPCLCCGAFWPQPTVDVRGDTLVYTYPSSGAARPERGVEAAVLRPVCR